MPIRIYARNYRVLRQADWQPEGTCLLVGANGSGKTTLLEVFDLLRYAFRYGLPQAVKHLGGPGGLRCLEATPEDPVILGIECQPLRWEIEVAVAGGQLQAAPAERLWLGGELLLRRAPGTAEWFYRGQAQTMRESEQERTCLRSVWERSSPDELGTLISAIEDMRVYDTYRLSTLRERGSQDDAEQFLNPHGTNLFSVLRTWNGARISNGDKMGWVIEHLRHAFPETFADLELLTTGRSVTALFYKPGRVRASEALPIHRAADGMLTGLLHLTALAGLPKGGVLAIDEMENQLHPYAIRSLLRSMTERAKAHGQTVLLTTHSPVLMNLFRDDPARIFVMEMNQPQLPVALDKLLDPEWLYHFSLGDLYARQEFGAQRGGHEPAQP